MGLTRVHPPHAALQFLPCQLRKFLPALRMSGLLFLRLQVLLMLLILRLWLWRRMQTSKRK
jgi:hypothetical protein